MTFHSELQVDDFTVFYMYDSQNKEFKTLQIRFIKLYFVLSYIGTQFLPSTDEYPNPSAEFCTVISCFHCGPTLTAEVCHDVIQVITWVVHAFHKPAGM